MREFVSGLENFVGVDRPLYTRVSQGPPSLYHGASIGPSSKIVSKAFSPGLGDVGKYMGKR